MHDEPYYVETLKRPHHTINAEDQSLTLLPHITVIDPV